jgi:hypothetical protein
LANLLIATLVCAGFGGIALVEQDPKAFEMGFPDDAAMMALAMADFDGSATDAQVGAEGWRTEFN